MAGWIALIFLLGAPAAQAGWLTPVDVSEPGEHVGTPHVVLDSAGNATAVWDRWSGTDTVVESSYRPAGAGWQVPVSLSGSGEAEAEEGEEIPTGAHNAQSARIAVDGDGDTTVIWERYAGTNRILVQSVYRPAGGSWQAPVDIAEVKTMTAPKPWIAVDPAGNATAVWKSGEVIESAYRPAGGSWQASVELSGTDSYTPQATVDVQGDVTAVWMHFDGSTYVVQSAYRPAGGSWEAPKLVSEPGEEGGNPYIALDADGDAMVVWRGESGGEEVARSAYRPVGGSWGTPTSVTTEGEAVQSLRIALDADGNAMVAWAGSTGEVGGYAIAKAAYRPVGGDWEAPIELSEDGGNAYPLDLVFDTSGNAAVAWERSNGTDNVVQAAYRPAEGSWQMPTDLSEEGKDAIDAVLVLDAPGDATAADGDATAIWTSVESVPCGEKPTCYSYTVQAAGYDIYDAPSEGLEVPPTASAGAPVEVSVPPVDIWSPLLEFGDGTSAASTSAMHTYSEAGEYTVTFASTNVLGYRTSAQRTITVGPGEGSLPPEGDMTDVPPVEPPTSNQAPGATTPSSESPSACSTAKEARKDALRQLKLTQARLRRGHPAEETRRLKRKSGRQVTALRRASRRVAEACAVG